MGKLTLSDYERGRLVLQAFALLDGWGTTDEKGVFKSFMLDKRQAKARELVEYACTAPEEPAQ
jgi:hypothetical protein